MGEGGDWGSGGTVEEGAHERSLRLCADYSILKSHNFDDVKSANNYDLKPWNVAAARPVNRSSNQPLCLTY